MTKRKRIWNVHSLKKYFDSSIFHIKQNTKIAGKEMDRRLNGMNEIRRQLVDQAATFVTKSELKLLDHEIKALSRLVYIGFGVWVILQVLITFILSLILKN